MVIPFLGHVQYRSENEFADSDEFLSYLIENRIDQVLFLTPYANDQRAALYFTCRDNDIRYFVFDRGALPDSWFFDSNGFNADSESYDPRYWNRPMSTEAREEIERYTGNLISSETTLEENGARIGVANFRSKYKLGEKKILFVPLQRPNDSVIRHFAGSAESMDNFCFMLSQIAVRLSSEWTIVVKRHPLETAMPPIPGAVVLDPATHVYDALSAADAVLLINSGVGLLSLLFEKPTYNFGQAFYSHPGLSQRVTSVEELCQELKSPKRPSIEQVLRFASYLVNDFYSFAKTTYRKVAEENGGARSVAVNLDFSVLRLPETEPILFDMREEPIKKSSPLYDYYRAYFSESHRPIKGAMEKKASAKEVDLRRPEVATSSQVIVVPNVNGKSSANKKLKKLVRNPKLFIVDALKKRLL